jgi:hypothetical protein
MTPYSVIVAGSRDIEDYALIASAIRDTGIEVGEVVSGGARGVDTLGEQYAAQHGIPVEPFPVSATEWKYLGNSAGRKRNAQMLVYCLNSTLESAIIAVWDGKSRGTAHMIQLALSNERHIQRHIYIVSRSPDGTTRLGRASDELVRALLARVNSKRRV